MSPVPPIADFDTDLRQATARAMQGPPCPPALREKIAAQLGLGIAEQPSVATVNVVQANNASRHPLRSFLMNPGHWRYAVAASFVLVLTAGYLIGAQGWRSPVEVAAQAEDRLAEDLTARNEACAANPDLLNHADRFSADLATLGNQIKAQVGLPGTATLPVRLDLRQAGFTYVKTGLCPMPGDDAVHVLYRDAAGRPIGVWIGHDDAPPLGVPDRLHVVDTQVGFVGRVRTAGLDIHVAAPDLTTLQRLLPVLFPKE